MRLLVLRFLFVVFWLLVCTAYAQPPVIGYNLLELPSSRRAIQALSQPMGLTISQTPIRDVLNSVSQSQSISIFLDRRIDPSLPVSIQASSRDSVLIDVLNRIGENAGAEISLIENVVYVGPRGKTQALQRTAVALHHSISFAQVRKGGPATTELHALEWDELSTPADIEAEIAKTWSIQSSLNLPHDLFHAWSIHQPCSLATQLAILCGGFGREPEFGAEGKFTSRDIQDIASWRTKYPVRDTRIAPDALSQLRNDYPGCQLLKRNTAWEVTGPTNLHIAILKLGLASPDAKAGMSLLRSGNLKGTAAAIIASLAQADGLRVEWSPACTEAQRTQLISFEVTNATTAQILQAFAEAAGLKVTLEGDLVGIEP